MKRKHLKKRIGSLLLAAAMSITSFPAFGTEVWASEIKTPVPSPSVTAFATKNQLMTAFKPNEEGMSKTIGKLAFGKDSQGEVQNWYILGEDEGVDGENTVLFASDSIAEGMFNLSYSGTYTPAANTGYDKESVSVYGNHYGASDLYKQLDEIAEDSGYFTSVEQGLMNKTTVKTWDQQNRLYYATTAKLYAPTGYYLQPSISAGSNGQIELRASTYWPSGKRFWLRDPHSGNNSHALYALPGSREVGNFPVDQSEGLRPAFSLNLSSVLFASAAEAALSESGKSGTIAKSAAMTLRMDGSDQEDIGTAIYDATHVSMLENPGEGKTVSLVVQGNDGTKDWYYSVSATEATSVTKAQIQEACGISDIDLAECKIWLETTEDGVTYAKMADADGSQNRFATARQLRGFNTDDTDGKNPVKVYFGKNDQEWWIAGSQQDDSVTLFAANPLAAKEKFDSDETGTKNYSVDWNCSYPENSIIKKVNANHYGASSLRRVKLKELETSCFSTSEQALMKDTTVYTNDTANSAVYSTTDKLYLAYAAEDKDQYITVGENVSGNLNNGLHIDDMYWKGDGFWLRAPDSNSASAWRAAPSEGVSAANLDEEFGVLPAFELDLSSVLFASAAKAASSESAASGTISENAAMTLRLDGSGKTFGAAACDAEAGEITALKAVDAEGTVSLIVQGGDWYYSVPAQAGEKKVVTKEEIQTACNLGEIDLAECKVWLETIEDSLVYARMAGVNLNDAAALVPGETLVREVETITNGQDGTVTVDKGHDGNVDVTVKLPQAGDIQVAEDGKITVPAGGTVQAAGGKELTLPNGGTVDADGNVEADVIVNGDTTVTAPEGGKLTADKDGNITVPAGGTVQTGDGEVTTLPNGGTVDKDGNVNASPTNPEKPFEGSGTKDEPYQIGSKDDLEKLRGLVNGGEGYDGIHFKVTADIDLDGSAENPWTPIGTEENPFKGIFNGDSHKVSSLYINDEMTDNQGLFGVNAGTIQNLTVSGSVTGNNKVGGIAGSNTENGIIKEVTVKGKVTGKDYVGSIAGINTAEGKIPGCTLEADVTGENYVGGIVGMNVGTVSEVTVLNGGVTGNGRCVGGIAGINNGTVNRVYTYGSGVNGFDCVGGVAGINNGIVEDAGNIQDVQGSGSGTGGVVGVNTGEVVDAYNNDPVTGKDDVGGIVGRNESDGTVKGCTNRGNVSMTEDGNGKLGAIIGNNQNMSPNTTPDVVEDDYYQTTQWINKDLTGIGGVTPNPSGITCGPGRDPAQNPDNPDTPEHPFGGSGTLEAPYLIRTEDDLKKLADLVNKGEGQGDAYYRIDAENGITLTDKNKPWTPIGTTDHPFTGTFDGNGKTISGLEMNNTDANNQGLFGVNAGTIENLTVTGNVTGKDNVGGIAGINTGTGTIQNCTNNANVTGKNNVDGIAGKNEGTITGCQNNGTVTGKTAVDEVKEKIDAIGDVTPDNAKDKKALIEDAREAYDKLTDDQKEQIDPLEKKKLTDAEKAYDDATGGHNQAAADKVKEKIDAIPDQVQNDGDTKKKIEDAREAYDKLTETQKDMVPEESKKKLTDAEKLYDEATNGSNQKAADKVKEKIDAIPSPVQNDLDTKLKLEDAREAYDDLTETQKDMVPKESKKKLEESENAYNKLVTDEVKKKIDAIGEVTLENAERKKDLIEDAREAYDNLTDEQKELIDSTEKKKLTDAEKAYDDAAEKQNQAAADEVERKIDAIPSLIQNNEDTKQKIEDARDAYDKLTETQKDMVSEESKKKLENAEDAYNKLAAEEVKQKIDAIGEVTQDNAVSKKDLIEDARDAYDNLTDEQKELIDSTEKKKLTDAEKIYDDATDKHNQTAADKVKEKIDAIPDQIKNDEETKQKIEDAREAYENLTGTQKDMVPEESRKKLEDSEHAYNKLVTEEVRKKIDAIGEVTADNAVSKKDLIEAARDAYDKLTDDQKEMIPPSEKKKLTDAEEQYNALINAADNAAAQNVVNKINAIGTVAKTDECEKKIKDARTAYDALTDTQKKLVPAAVLKKLTDAEAAYAALKNPSNPSPEKQQQIDNIAEKLGVSKETAQKIQAVADELGVSVETLMLTDNSFNSQSEDDIKGSTFSLLQLKVTKIAAKQVTLKWKKVKAADGYQIYGTRCGKGNKTKLITTIEKNSKTRFVVKKLLKGKAYRYVVRAYKVIDGHKITIAASKTAHIFTSGGKYGNAKSVKVNKSKVQIKKGKNFKIKAKEVKANKPLKRHRKLCYESSNPDVATVTKKGVIKGKSKGTCTIYAYAQNGVYKKIKVTVK